MFYGLTGHEYILHLIATIYNGGLVYNLKDNTITMLSNARMYTKKLSPMLFLALFNPKALRAFSLCFCAFYIVV